MRDFYMVFVMLLFGLFVFYFFSEHNDTQTAERELEETYPVETVSIGEEIYSNDKIQYSLNGISRFDIIISSTTPEGKTVDYTYPRRMDSFIKLKNTDVSIKFKQISSEEGSMSYYVAEELSDENTTEEGVE